MHLSRARSPRNSGQTQTLELALVFPILMLVVLGIVAFGQLFSFRIRLDNAAREGARRGSTGGTKADIETVIRNRLNSMPGITNTVCGGGNPCMIVAVKPDDDSQARVVGDDLVVNIRYDARVSVPLLGFFMSPKTLYARCVMRIERLPAP